MKIVVRIKEIIADAAKRDLSIEELSRIVQSTDLGEEHRNVFIAFWESERSNVKK
jgi:hypothetical protein